jgi:hypothetical protein
MEGEDLDMDDISGETIVPESSTSQETNFNENAEYNTAAFDTDVSMSLAPNFDKDLVTEELEFTNDEDILDIALKNSKWKGKYTKTGVRK